MEIGERIKRRREELGITVDEVAKRLGKHRATIYRYESDEIRTLPTDVLEPLAVILETTPAALMGWGNFDAPKVNAFSTSPAYSPSEDTLIKKYRALDEHGKRIVDMVIDEETARMVEAQQVQELEPQNSQMSYINCYDLAVSAGIGEPWSSDYGYKTRLEIPTYQVPENTHYCARVNGDSMEPAYKDGDIVFVQHLDGESVRVGEVGVFALNGDGYIKKLGEGALESLNPKYSPIVIREHDDLRCQGRVLGKI